MSANNFFDKYSIEEISKRTKISPISLRFIKNKEYEKIPRVKFIGFIKIMEREFKVDLSDLVEEFDSVNPPKEIQEPQIQPQEIKKEEKKPIVWILAIILLLLAGSLLLFFNSPKKTVTTKQNIEKNVTTPKKETKKESENLIVYNEENETNESNISTSAIQIQNEQNETAKAQNENNETFALNQEPPKEEIKKPVTYSAIIIPLKKVWFKAVNLKTKKIISKIVSKPFTLPQGNYYIKFGHGLVKIKYADQTIDPNTKKIVKIVLKNGKYEYVNKQPKD